MSEISYSKALFDCALECALLRKNRRCHNQFRSIICNDCKYYLCKYIDAAPRDVELFMMQAEMRAGAIKATSGGHHFVFAFLIGMCLFFAYLNYNHEKTKPNFRESPRNSVVSSGHDDIMTSLRKVAKDLENRVDVNGDGKTNCIDAAVKFYKYYPDKSKVDISVNRNPKTGMHHLFNIVLIDGVWRAIEPQAVFTNHRSYFMRDVWGTKYDHTLNRVVTSDYLKYVR